MYLVQNKKEIEEVPAKMGIYGQKFQLQILEGDKKKRIVATQKDRHWKGKYPVPVALLFAICFRKNILSDNINIMQVILAYGQIVSRLTLHILFLVPSSKYLYAVR